MDLPGFEEATNETIRKKLSLLASFNLSLRKLSEEKLQKFAWLGVVPEDVTLTQKMVTTLWETNLWTARNTLRYLRDKALLLEDIPLADGTPTYRLHDLVHDISRRVLTSPVKPELEEDLPGLGLTLQDAHSELLNRYQQCTEDGLWHQVPDDGYVHSYLAWHMEQAGCGEELHKLLKEETAEGQNGWYQARERLDQITGYLADVTRTWKLAEEAFTNHQFLTLLVALMLIKNCDWHCLKILIFKTVLDQISHRYIGLQIRYALITASLNSIADNISPELLGALVKQKIWTVEQGLAYARQKTNPVQKAEGLTLIAANQSELEIEELFQEALTIIQGQERIGYKYGYEKILIKVQEIIINCYVRFSAERHSDISIFRLEKALKRVKTFKTKQKVIGLIGLMPYLSKLQLDTVTKELNKTFQELLSQDQDIFRFHQEKDAGVPNCSIV